MRDEYEGWKIQVSYYPPQKGWRENSVIVHTELLDFHISSIVEFK